jgi:hypothetical protein
MNKQDLSNISNLYNEGVKSQQLTEASHYDSPYTPKANRSGNGLVDALAGVDAIGAESLQHYIESEHDTAIKADIADMLKNFASYTHYLKGAAQQ